MGLSGPILASLGPFRRRGLKTDGPFFEISDLTPNPPSKPLSCEWELDREVRRLASCIQVLKRPNTELSRIRGRCEGFCYKNSAHRGANGLAMPTDEDDQDGHFFYNHPRGGPTSPPRRAQPLLLLFRSKPPTEGGSENKKGRVISLFFSI